MPITYKLDNPDFADSDREDVWGIDFTQNVVSSPTTQLDSELPIAPKQAAVRELGKRRIKPAEAEDWELVEDLAYELYENKHLSGGSWEKEIFTFREDGFSCDLITYKVKRIETPEGLNAFILQPIIDENWPRGAIPEIKVLFTGTIDMAGVGRDLLEIKAAGHHSFKEQKHNLMAELDAAVREIKDEHENVKISVGGHSLGGLDGLRLGLKITQAIAREDPAQEMLREGYMNDASKQEKKAKAEKKPKPMYDGLRSKRIHLHIIASEAPKGTKDQSQKFADNLQIATDETREKPLKVTATVFNMSEDIVPCYGEQNMLIQRTSDDQESVLNMIDATVIAVKTSSFNHSINFYHDPEHPAVDEIEVFETKKGKSDPVIEQKIAEKLNKSIARFIFEKTIKKVIETIKMQLGRDKALNTAPKPALEFSADRHAAAPNLPKTS